MTWMVRLGYPLGLTPAERARLQPPLHLAPSALAAALVVQFSWLEWAGQRVGCESDLPDVVSRPDVQVAQWATRPPE